MKYTPLIIVLAIIFVICMVVIQRQKLKESTSIPDSNVVNFADIVLVIENVQKNGDGSYELMAKGEYKNEIIGLKVTVAGGIKKGINEGKPDTSAFTPNGVSFSSLGFESDKFLHALSEMYGINSNQVFSKDDVFFTVFALEEQELNLEAKPVHFKVFYDDNNEKGLYSEFYLNIDVPNKKLEIAEKDIQYRENIIKSLTE